MTIVLRPYIRIAFPILLGLLALGVPLLRDFHMESALLVSLIGCFWAGWKAAGPKQNGDSDVRSAVRILGYLYLFGLPLLFYTLLTGCFSVHGLGFWLLYPIPSVFFGYAIGRLFRIWQLPYSRAAALIILLAVAVGLFLVEFLSFPQVYFFNHVWGGWPGPLYDETVHITGSLLYFRMLTLFWILLLWFIPSYTHDKQSRLIFWFAAIALGLGYTQLAEAGIITPEEYLRRQLSGRQETAHFVIHYDSSHYSGDDIGLLAREHEFYLDEITERLELPKPDSTEKIRSYLYAHPWQKKALVGAKFTSYVPVWLERDQLHIAKQQIRHSLRHELVHVLSKQFGNRLFNGSWSIGLIEGVAVALAPDESASSTIDQIVASDSTWPGATEMRQALLPMGFYGGRSAVNYTTSGSFVKFLLEEYPVEQFKQAYRTGNVEAAYGHSFSQLVQGWHNRLSAAEIDSVDRRIARRMFGIPSLFEQACPRIQTFFARHWDRFEWRMAEGDTTSALQSLDAALDRASENQRVKAEWTYLNLKAGNTDRVRQRVSVDDSSAELQMLYADAFALTDGWQSAKLHMDRAEKLAGKRPAPGLKRALATRQDREQWQYYLDLTYRQRLFTPDVFSRLYYRTKIRTLEQVMESRQFDRLKVYARLLLTDEPDRAYLGQYLTMIHWLGYLGEYELAGRWLEKLEGMPLRERHKERLDEQHRWTRYLENQAD